MIKGFRGVSLVDFPNHLASVIFTCGCNLRCPFCYNLDLVVPERYTKLPELPIEGLLSKLRERQGFLQGVVVTGGEPTLWGKGLIALLHPPLLSLQELTQLLPYLQGAKRVALQKFLPTETLGKGEVKPYSPREMEALYRFLTENLKGAQILRRF